MGRIIWHLAYQRARWCFLHCSLQSTSHNHSPDTGCFFPEIMVCFIGQRVGIYVVNLACELWVHDKRLSGQLLLILPPLAMVQWENKLFTNVFFAFSWEAISSMFVMVSLSWSETCVHCSGIVLVFSSLLLPRTLYFLREVEWDMQLTEKYGYNVATFSGILFSNSQPLSVFLFS